MGGGCLSFVDSKMIVSSAVFGSYLPVMCAWGGRSDKVALKTTLVMVQNVVRKGRTLFESIPSVFSSFLHPFLLT